MDNIFKHFLRNFHRFLSFLKIIHTDEPFIALKRLKKIKDNINTDARNYFRKKEEIDDNTIKDVRNLFRPKGNEAVNDKGIRDIRNHFESKS